MLPKARRLVLAGGLPLLFLLVTLVPAAALITLGLRLASQDQTLLAQQIAESRQADLDRAVNALAAEVQSWREVLATRDFRSVASLPSDSAVILVSAGEVRAIPLGRMPWSPLPPRLTHSPDGPFREAERLEFEEAHEEQSRRSYESLA